MVKRFVPDRTLLFDIEAGGLYAHKSPLLSIAYARGMEPVQELYAAPSPGSWISRWSQTQVLARIERRLSFLKRKAMSEQMALTEFLTVLQRHTTQPGSQLAGFNIGYQPKAQAFGETRMKGFDIPFLMTRARKYGLEKQYRDVLRKTEIRDVGAEWAARIAGIVSKPRYRDLVDKDLWQQAYGIQKAIRGAGLGSASLAARARFIQQGGYKFAGWKQEAVYGLLGLGKYKAHMAHEDVAALRAMMDTGVKISDERAFVRAWGRAALVNKLVSSARWGGKELGELQAIARQAGVYDEFMGKLQLQLDAVGATLADVAHGRGIPESFAKVAEGIFAPRLTPSLGGIKSAGRALGEFVAENKIGLGVGLAAAAVMVLQPLNLFSGKDDNWNTLEGLRHGGQAEKKRRELTEFGSGWVGPTIQIADDLIPAFARYRLSRGDLTSFNFSGFNDQFNTISGFQHRGMAGRRRRYATDFGSGYQKNQLRHPAAFYAGTELFSFGAMGLYNVYGNLKLASAYKRGYMDVFHGTPQKNVASIQQTGIHPNPTSYQDMLEVYAATHNIPIENAESVLQSGKVPSSIPASAWASMKEKVTRTFYSGEKWVARAHAGMEPEKGIGPLTANMSIGNPFGYFSGQVRGGQGAGEIFRIRMPIDKLIPQSSAALQLETGILGKRGAQFVSHVAQAIIPTSMPTMEMSRLGITAPQELLGAIKTEGGRYGAERVINSLASDFVATPHLEKAALRLGMAAVPIALVGAGLALMNWGGIGRKQDHNTIRGLSHKGISAKRRRVLTEFGSGWQGTKQSITRFGSKVGRFAAEHPAEIAEVGLVTALIGVPAWLNYRVYKKGQEAAKDLKSIETLNKKYPTTRQGLKGFSVQDITEAAAKAKQQSVEEFAKAMEVHLTKKPLKYWGGGATIQRTHQSFVYKDAEKILENIEEREYGFKPLSHRYAKDFQKIWIFHEAMEARNRSEIERRGGDNWKLPLKEYLEKKEQFAQTSHFVTLPQEELFTRLASPKPVRRYIKDIRITANHFSGFDDKYNTIPGLRHGNVASVFRNLLTDFGSGYKGLKDQSEYGQKVGERFELLTQALEKYGLEEGTGHKRIIIPKKVLSKEDLEKVLGFVPVKIAVPEAGQTSMMSYRNPSNLFHLHEHGDVWTMHRDELPATTMLLRKWSEEKTIAQKADFLTPVKLAVEGMPHVLTEGVPGMYYWLKGQVLRGEGMRARLEKDLSTEYKEFIADMQHLERPGLLSRLRSMVVTGVRNLGESMQDLGRRVIPGGDDHYNTIPGLSHSGMAGRNRRYATDFGSGWLRTALSKGISRAAIVEKWLGEEAGVGLYKLTPEVFRSKALGVRTEEAFVRFLRASRRVQGDTERFLVTKKLGEGGMGQAFKLRGISSSRGIAPSNRAAVFKRVLPGRIEEPMEVGAIPTGPHINRAIRTAGDSRYDYDALRRVYPYIQEYGAQIYHGVQGYGGILGMKYEVAMQRAARKQFGDIVPEVLGETKTGFIQEFGGKELEAIEASRPYFKQAEKLWKQVMHYKGEGVRHFDPQVRNIVRRGTRLQIIDWGVAAQWTELSEASRSISSDVLSKYIESLSRQLQPNVDRSAVEALNLPTITRKTNLASRIESRRTWVVDPEAPTAKHGLIAGLREEGLAPTIRHEMTDSGSRSDALKLLFKNAKERVEASWFKVLGKVPGTSANAWAKMLQTSEQKQAMAIYGGFRKMGPKPQIDLRDFEDAITMADVPQHLRKFFNPSRPAQLKAGIAPRTYTDDWMHKLPGFDPKRQAGGEWVFAKESILTEAKQSAAEGHVLNAMQRNKLGTEGVRAPRPSAVERRDWVPDPVVDKKAQSELQYAASKQFSENAATGGKRHTTKKLF